MSQVTIEEKFTINGELTDITSAVLSDPDSIFGVKRNDTDEVVVVDGKEMEKVATGVYRHIFTEPDIGLTYTYWVEWVYNGETYHDEHTISGASTSCRICLLADVKERLGLDNTDNDDLLTRVILGLENIFDGECHRPLIMTDSDVTEYFSAMGSYLQLNRYPVISITSLKQALDYDFDSAEALEENVDYRLMNNGVNGIIRRINLQWFEVPDSIQVLSRGGFCAAGVSPAEGEIALPAKIREAAIEQATFIYKRKDDIGLSGVGFQGGSISKFSAIELLPMVKNILSDYKKPSL